MCGAYYKRDEIIPQQAEHLRLSIAILPLLGAIEAILPIGAIEAILAIRGLGAILAFERSLGAIRQHMVLGDPPKPDITGKKKNRNQM